LTVFLQGLLNFQCRCESAARPSYGMAGRGRWWHLQLSRGRPATVPQASVQVRRRYRWALGLLVARYRIHHQNCRTAQERGTGRGAGSRV